MVELINPIICAVDASDADEASTIANQVRPHVGAVKLGLEYFTANGAPGVDYITRLGIPVFLDLKFHDIPNTVAAAMQAIHVYEPTIVTVHASGGRAMMEDAKAAAANGTKVVAVTMLTSLDAGDLSATGVYGSAETQVMRLAELAHVTGLDARTGRPFDSDALTVTDCAFKDNSSNAGGALFQDGDGTLAWRFPMADMEIQNGGSLTVRESQMAVFVNEGKVADVFGPGMYKLTTQTLPVLTYLKNWDKLFNSPFKSDVYFFSTRQQVDQKWGTPQPITIRDADFGAVRLRAFGNYNFRIADPKLFHTEISGTRERYTVSEGGIIVVGKGQKVEIG